VPAPPELAVENLAAVREREIVEARREAVRLQQILRAAPRRETAADLVEVVLGREAVIQRYRALNSGAKELVDILLKAPYVSTMTENPAELAALARGVRYRLLYEASLLELPNQLEVVARFRAAGAQVKVLSSLPTKLAVFDRRYSYLAYAPPGDDAAVGALLVHPSPLLDALSRLFEYLWDQAVSFTTTSPSQHGPTPSADDKVLLTLLAAGMKDEAIARHLQLGHRTVQRRVARLMAGLGAETRFQAGLQARDRGWLGSGEHGPA
jgi:DNA-binding NarL/FixJ family response regulator